MALAKQKLAETWSAETQKHPQPKRAVLKSSTLSTDPDIVGESILWHLDELVFDAKTARAIEANACCLVGVADPGARRFIPVKARFSV